MGQNTIGCHNNEDYGKVSAAMSRGRREHVSDCVPGVLWRRP